MSEFSRRERQILDILFAAEEATAVQIREVMDDPPADATVRTILRILEEKQAVVRRKEGKRFIYRPRKQKKKAGRLALRRVLKVFYGGSLEQAMAAHLTDPKTKLDQDAIANLRALIDEAESQQATQSSRLKKSQSRKEKRG